MVGTIGFQLAKNRKIVGFGYRPKTKALDNFLLNRLEAVIRGSGRKIVHRKRTIGASYRLSGQGVKSRKPKSVINKKRPRKTLVGKRVVHRKKC